MAEEIIQWLFVFGFGSFFNLSKLAEIFKAHITEFFLSGQKMEKPTLLRVLE